MIPRTTRLAVLLGILISLHPLAAASDPLPSWNDGPAKQAIFDFVADVTDIEMGTFVPPSERIAVFDNDGTLWVEKPYYTQLAFALDRVKVLAPEHPEWKTTPPFQSVLEGDIDGVLASGRPGMHQLVMATHSGMTPDDFEKIAVRWLDGAKHPRFGRAYTDLAYQPMLELLAYLRRHGFRTYIVSAGGIDFMRPWTRRVYGIPREQVIGSSILVEFAMEQGVPYLVRRPEIFFVHDGPGKPVGVQTFIGRRPTAAFGNSDGDLEMLLWTTAGSGRRLGMLIHHTDAEREYAYDRESPVGRLDRALDEAPRRDWTVVDMKRDWKRVFHFEE